MENAHNSTLWHSLFDPYNYFEETGNQGWMAKIEKKMQEEFAASTKKSGRKQLITEFEYLLNRATAVGRRIVEEKTILIKKGGKLISVKCGNTLNESDAEVAAEKAVEKVLKGGKYDLTWTKKAKNTYITTAVHFEAFDLFKQRKGRGAPDDLDLYDESEDLGDAA